MTTPSDLTNEQTVQMQPVAVDSTCVDLPASILHAEEMPGRAEQQQSLRVYLRVRPFSKEELADNEDQSCVVIESRQTVMLHAPKGSATMKSSERGIGLPSHKFTFSQIFGPETTQAELFQDTIKSQVSEFLDGKNALIFSYGVTNAGKTYTILGTPKEPGLLPQVLDATFQYIAGRQYEAMDLKPYLRNDAQCLGPDQIKQERSAKTAIFASFKEDCDPVRGSGGSNSLSSPAIGLSFSSLSCEQTVVSSPLGSSQFALWVSYFEIYNESVYDLLQPPLCSKSKKRAGLRVCEDAAGDTYVRDLKWIHIKNMEEACKLLRFGNRNRSAAATKMNQSSSRSHSIFTMKLLKIDGSTVQRVSEFSLCDLAGSERCNKTNTFGERLKEAGNINNSLLILGKCITALRNNQTDRMKNSYIPFRESKLTKLFQAVFCGKGRASLIVNINQCASTYDETLHVMKFSAAAKQVVQVIPAKSLESLAPRLVGRDGKPLEALKSYLSEEELLDEEDEADMSILPQNELLNVIESLRAKLLAERRKNLVQEMEIRKEMGDAMLQQLMESEELRSRQMEELKESYQERLENTFDMYKDAIKEHAYQCAMNRVEDDYVPVEEFIAEQENAEALRRELSELKSLVSTARRAPVLDQSCQTQSSTDTAGDDRWKRLYKEKCAIEKMCEDKQQLILALEQRLLDLNETHHTLKDDFLQKCADLEALQRKAETNSIHDLLRENADKDNEIASLKAECCKLSQKSSVPPKTKRGLLSNIRESVTSPGKSAIGRTLRKTVRATPSKHKLSS
ncbi:kinesin-like protein KIF20A isoform X2 [Myripristis murdjan]|uniref:kinesin-like protein KIF20A isoform X2 n=1 Tax=Myripristis murdjan TaxID=586833 RepID=UPI00117628BD|nr:kinesin-like protein KIF20A isoform X2 [Myripristis murdjan]